MLLAGRLTVAASPYRDMTVRQIKSLSSERIEALRTGAGSGYALAAEQCGQYGRLRGYERGHSHQGHGQ